LWSRASVCLSVCLSVAAYPHYCMDPDVTWRSGRGCPLVVHCWGFAIGARVALLWQHYGNAWQTAEPSSNPPGPPHAARMPHTHTTHAGKDSPRRRSAPAACSVPFRPYCGGVVTRTRNVSEYMFVVALCLLPSCYCCR